MDESSDKADGGTDGGRVAELRRRADAAGSQLRDWFERRRAERVPYDLAASFYERDRESFASVLGAAIALRLFLFVVAISLLLAGALILVAGADAVRTVLSQANVTGNLAGQIGGAAARNSSAGISMVLLGLWLTLTNGRKLTNVLAACSASAWHLDSRQARPTLRMAVGVTTLVMVMMLTASGLNRLRDATGLGVETMSWAAATAVFGIGWFTVTSTLPRSTTDPGALLPGAALVGSVMAVFQWFMQFYLPTKIARSSEVMGSLGFTVATLGYMFVIGRLMAASLILNAVVWERFGSISGLVFSLPVLRRLPARSARLARFFDLDRTSETGR
jgi:hypothetical protein